MAKRPLSQDPVCQATSNIRRQLAAAALTLRRLPPEGRRPLPATPRGQEYQTELTARAIASACSPLFGRNDQQYATPNQLSGPLPASPWAELLP